MDAIILAGGFGSRLQSVVKDIPKPMALINNRPFLSILLESLRINGIHRVVLSVGYKFDYIYEYFGSNFNGLELVYSIESEPLGTGGAIAKALNHVVGDAALVLNGDTFINLETEKLFKFWDLNKVPIMLVHYVENSGRYGRVEFSDTQIISFHEKGIEIAGFINAGCYLLPKSIFDGFKLPEKFSFEQNFLTEYIIQNKMMAYPSNGLFIDIGIPEDYQLAQILLRDS